MKLTAVLIKCLILGLFVSTYRAKIIIETSQSRESSIDPLLAATAKIIKSSYPRGSETILFVGNGIEDLVTSLLSEETFAVIFFNDIKKLASNGIVPGMPPYKPKMVAVSFSSLMQLEETFVAIKSSRWWNYEARFYIIDRSLGENGCSKASDILWAAWKMDLLETKFMCSHGTKGRLIYTFNPYSKVAPEPWRVETVRSGKDDHPWTLLVRRYSDNDQIYENIDFDKTKKLDGYPIYATVKNSSELQINPAKTGIDALTGINAELMHDIFHTMNATLKLVAHGANDSWGDLDGNISYGILEDLVNGISDIGINHRYPNAASRFKFSSPYAWSGLVIMTQFRGYKSQLDKFMSVMDRSSQIGLLVILFLTPILLKCFLRRSLIISILDTVRVFSNSSLLKIPVNPASRIFLSSLFMFLITIQALYQGQLFSLLGIEINIPNIESMEDLAMSGYKIYGNEMYAAWFDDPMFKGRYIPIKGFNCTEYVIRDPMAACVSEKFRIVYNAVEAKLHVSEKLISTVQIGWVMRDNWPLERKLNHLLNIYRESRMLHHAYVMDIQKQLRILELLEDGTTNNRSKPLTPHDFSFAFIFLGIGLTCAILTFIIERKIGRARSTV